MSTRRRHSALGRHASAHRVHYEPVGTRTDYQTGPLAGGGPAGRWVADRDHAVQRAGPRLTARVGQLGTTSERQLTPWATDLGTPAQRASLASAAEPGAGVASR